MNTTQILAAASELLVTKGWTQGESAKDKDGYCVPSYSPRATCYCLIGAIEKVAPSWDGLEARDALRRVLGVDNIVKWNDTPGRTKEEVLKAIDGAIMSDDAIMSDNDN